MTYEEAVIVANKLKQIYNPSELHYKEVSTFCELALRSAWRDKDDREQQQKAKEAA